MKKTVLWLLALLAGNFGFHCCLTWNFDENSIRFLCRINGSREMYLVDNHEQYIASCVFNGSAVKCNTTDFVTVDIEENVVTFKIDRSWKADLNGNWSCLQQDHKFITEILTSDVADSMAVDLSGKIIYDDDVQRILLTCSSCRIPKGKNAEFLINNSSVNSVTFNDHTGKCTNLHGECSSSKCNCSSFGNAFSLFVSIEKQITTSTNYSCDMRFEDKAKSIVFSKVATVSFNGKEFKNRGIRTIISKFADDHDWSKDEENHSDEIVISVIVSVALAVVLTLGAYLYWKGRKYGRKNHTEEDTISNGREFEKKYRPEEDIPLIGRKLEKKDMTGEVTLVLEYCLQKLTKATPKFFEVKNEIDLCLKKSNEARTACKDTEKESWFKEVHSKLTEIKNGSEILLQKLQEIITRFTNDNSETQIYEETVDDDSVQALVPIEIHKKTLDEDHVQAQVHIPSKSKYITGSIVIDKRILLKLTEDYDSYINRPAYHMDTKLDVIFMNCDSPVEFKWVLQVAKVLEDDFHLRCGIPGIDLESFKSVSETSKVIITFSEKSARIPDTLKMAEYLPLVVIVMVEDCSIPVQYTFMKCVDATKGVDVWFRNLLTALKIRSPEF